MLTEREDKMNQREEYAEDLYSDNRRDITLEEAETWHNISKSEVK